MWCLSRSAGERRCTENCGGTWAKFRMLAEQKESRIEEGHLLPDHVDMMIAIPPKYAVSQVVGFIKGKSAIHLAQVDGEQKRNFVGSTFGQEDIYVSPVGRDEAVIRDYIRQQQLEDKRLEQITCGANRPPVKGWPQTVGAASATPHSRFVRLTT